MALFALPAPMPFPGGAAARVSSRSLPSVAAPLLRVGRIQCSALPEERGSHGAQAAISPATATPSMVAGSNRDLWCAADIVVEFYGLINKRDPDAASTLIADECVYEDLAFGEPFVGKKAILGLFKKFTDGLSPDLAFVIDDITTSDPDAAGLTWHVAWKDKSFPFSRGCSFCRCKVISGQRKITYMRDIVESPVKPGDASLVHITACPFQVAIKGVTALLERFPQLANGW